MDSEVFEQAVPVQLLFSSMAEQEVVGLAWKCQSYQCFADSNSRHSGQGVEEEALLLSSPLLLPL